MVQANQDEPVARLVVQGTDPGGLYSVQRALTQLFKNIDAEAQARVNKSKGCVEITGKLDPVQFGLCEARAQRLLRSEVKCFYYGKGNSSEGNDLGSEGSGNSRGLEDSAREQPVSLYKARIAGLEASVTSLVQQLDVALDKADRFKADSEEFLVVNDRLTQENARLSTSEMSLQERVAALEKEVRPVDSFSGRALYHLSQFAGRLAEVESVVGDAAFSFVQIPLESILVRANSLGLEPVDEEIGAARLLEKYFSYPDSTAQLEAAFDRLNPEQAAAHSQTVSEMASLEASKAAALAALPPSHPDAARIAENYEELISPKIEAVSRHASGRKAFVEGARSVLSDVEKQLSQYTASARLKREVSKALDSSRLPVLIVMSESREDYSVSVHFPVNGSQDTRLSAIVLAENIFAEKVAALMRADDFDAIRQYEEPEFGLLSYSLKLGKSNYSLERALQVENAIKESVRSRFDHTSLPELGIGLDVIVNHVVSHENTAPAPSTAGQVDLADAAQYVLGVLSRAKAADLSISNEQIQTNVRSEFSVEMDADTVRALLNNLKQAGYKITDNGVYGRGRRYVLEASPQTVSPALPQDGIAASSSVVSRQPARRLTLDEMRLQTMDAILLESPGEFVDTDYLHQRVREKLGIKLSLDQFRADLRAYRSKHPDAEFAEDKGVRKLGSG